MYCRRSATLNPCATRGTSIISLPMGEDAKLPGKIPVGAIKMSLVDSARPLTGNVSSLRFSLAAFLKRDEIKDHQNHQSITVTELA